MPKDDLSGQNLDHGSFSDANMSDVDLSKSSLRQSQLKRTNLRNSNLTGSDLHGAHLEQADVTGANLRDTDLSDADLRGVDLSRAGSIEGVKLEGAKGVANDIANQVASDGVVNLRWQDSPAGPRSVNDLLQAIADANLEILTAAQRERDRQATSPVPHDQVNALELIAQLQQRRDEMELRLVHAFQERDGLSPG